MANDKEQVETTSFEMLKLVLQNQQLIFLILERMNKRRFIPDATIKEALKMQHTNIEKWENRQK